MSQIKPGNFKSRFTYVDFVKMQSESEIFGEDVDVDQASFTLAVAASPSGVFNVAATRAVRDLSPEYLGIIMNRVGARAAVLLSFMYLVYYAIDEDEVDVLIDFLMKLAQSETVVVDHGAVVGFSVVLDIRYAATIWPVSMPVNSLPANDHPLKSPNVAFASALYGTVCYICGLNPADTDDTGTLTVIFQMILSNVAILSQRSVSDE